MSRPVDPARPGSDQSVGQLMTQLSEQTSRLVRDELLLAQVELKNSAKHAGVGAGLFGGGGILALFGFGALVTAAIAGLALVLPLWLSALIVGAVLLIVAGVVALLGKKQVEQSTPAMERTVDSVKEDVRQVQEARHHGQSK
ncbi:MAG: phage holin family protein [Dietzia cercidiphylli]